MTLARELWNARDALAREKDVAPGRLVPDASLIVAAKMNPRLRGELAGNKDFRGRASRSELDRWWQAILSKTAEPPTPKPRTRDKDAVPHHRNWAQRFPEAAERLAAARDAVMAEAERQNMPVENLAHTRCNASAGVGSGLRELTAEAVKARLIELGARNWQAVLTAPILAEVFVELA